ncbi:hypothetical protein G6F56_010246 [Rhizopus delemar]|nr:hypothetical protein G6F56_010246 [Rhizopus delemar]
MKAEYCVDYLSYKWKAEDLIQTYRENCKSMSHKQDKYEEHNLQRLQNALWRQMARKCTTKLSQSNELIHPSSVSWQKESDITWLYGPIYIVQNETQIHPVPVSHLQGIKPVLKKNTTPVQHVRLPICSDEKMQYYTSSSDSSYVSSRNNSFSSVSTSSKVGVHFNPEIIEIEYQPENPISTTPQLEEEDECDELWSSLLVYLQHHHSGLNLVILLFKSFFSITSTWLFYQRLSRWVFEKQKNKRFL